MTDSSSTEKRGWFQRLKAGLSRSSSKLTESITGIFTKRKLDRALLDELEEALIAADLGPATAEKLTAALAKDRYDKEVTSEEVRSLFADEIAKLLDPVAKPLSTIQRKPWPRPSVAPAETHSAAAANSATPRYGLKKGARRRSACIPSN